MKQRVLFLIFITLSIVSAHAQKGYNIKFNVAGIADTTVYLGNFFGESTYVRDTATVDANGNFSFTGKKPLETGVYFIVLNKSRLFDIVIDKDQDFSIKTNRPDFVKSAKISGSEENQIFFSNIIYNIERNDEAQPFVKILQDSLQTEDKKAEARKGLEKINQKVLQHQDEIIAKHPNSIVAKMLKANKRIDVPEAPLMANGKPDPDFRYNYYKNHYWDYFDLSDPTLIRLADPIYKKKVEDYLDKLIVQHPDTVIKELNKMAAVAKKNTDTYKYLVWTAAIKYQQPEIMGLDEVFVDIYDQYFESGEMDFWANASLKKNLKERADQLRNSLVGKQAPPLKIQDENLVPQALYDVPHKYTIIYIYDPDCGHCKKETPKLKSFYDETTFDVGIYAISADSSLTKMKEYIKKMHIEEWTTVNGPRTYTEHYRKLYDALTTPTIYVLNDKKKIIAKKLPADRLQDFLEKYTKMEAELKENEASQ